MRVLFVILVLLLTTIATSSATERPNIVILYADDMGYGDLAIQNPQSKIPTPNLDQLAREGMRFTDAHSSSGICTPSRYALLTGRYHWRKFHDIVNSFEPSVFGPKEVTLPGLLQSKGYRTACIGKWHLGWDWKAIMHPGAKPDPKQGYAAADFDWSKPIPDGPLAHGFDYYFGDDVPNFPPYTWIENDRVLTAPTQSFVPNPSPREGNPEGRPGPMAEGWRLDAVMPRLTERAVKWIDDQKGSDKPFFLYFPFTSPHAPIVPTDQFRGKSQAGEFGDFVVESDWAAGEVLNALKRNGFADNTLVIFTADNGPELYAFERVRKFNHRSMGPLRGLKRDAWEGGHRVPMIVRWPGTVKPGSVCDALVSQIDLMATIAEITGTELPEGAADDSLSALAVWKGEKEAGRESLVHNTFANVYAIRQSDWLLIDAKSGEHSKMPPWFSQANGYKRNPHPAALYNLREDLGQKHNLFAEHPEKVAELRQVLAKIRKAGQRTVSQ